MWSISPPRTAHYSTMPAVIYMLNAFERFVNAGGIVTKTMLADWKRLLAEAAKLGMFDCFSPVMWLHSRRPVLRFIGAMLAASFKPRLTADEAIAVSTAMAWAGCTQIQGWVLPYYEGSIEHLTTIEHQASMQELHDVPMRAMFQATHAFDSASTPEARAAAFEAIAGDDALRAFSAPSIASGGAYSLFAFIEPLAFVMPRVEQGMPRPLGAAAFLVTVMVRRPEATTSWSDPMRAEVLRTLMALRTSPHWAASVPSELDRVATELLMGEFAVRLSVARPPNSPGGASSSAWSGTGSSHSVGAHSSCRPTGGASGTGSAGSSTAAHSEMSISGRCSSCGSSSRASPSIFLETPSPQPSAVEARYHDEGAAAGEFLRGDDLLSLWDDVEATGIESASDKGDGGGGGIGGGGAGLDAGPFVRLIRPNESASWG